jgi:CNT family concentrative nucleoside transporter
MSDIRESRRSAEIQEVRASDHKGRHEGAELASYRTPETDLESGDAREKKMASPQLESYNDGDSQSRVGSVRGEEAGKANWTSLGYVYRRFKPLFHLAIWLVWTA